MIIMASTISKRAEAEKYKLQSESYWNHREISKQVSILIPDVPRHSSSIFSALELLRLMAHTVPRFQLHKTRPAMVAGRRGRPSSSGCDGELRRLVSERRVHHVASLRDMALTGSHTAADRLWAASARQSGDNTSSYLLPKPDRYRHAQTLSLQSPDPSSVWIRTKIRTKDFGMDP